MRSHHTLAEVAGRYKDQSVMSLARALTSYIDVSLNGGKDKVDERVYETAHYDPIILGFILGRNWPTCEDEAVAAIVKDFEYDKHIISISPSAGPRIIKVVKGLDVSKLEFKL